MGIETSRFGQRLRQLRLAKGLELGEVAQWIECPVKTLDGFERGRLDALTPTLIHARTLHIRSARGAPGDEMRTRMRDTLGA